MRRKFNLKFFGILLAVVILPAIGVHFLHAFQVKRQASALYEQAGREENQGNPTQAAAYLDRYLRHTPDDIPTKIRYADLLLEQKPPSRVAWEKAFIVLDQIVARQPDNEELRRRLVKLAMGLGRGYYPTAITHLQYIVKNKPGDSEALLQLGQCQEGRDQFPAAIESYSRAIRNDPKRVDAYVRLAVLVRSQLKENARAVQLMNEMVNANKDSWMAWIARAEYLRSAGKVEDAAQDAARALSLAPDEAVVLLESARIYAAQEKVDEARKLLQHGVEKHPDNVALHQSLTGLTVRKQGRPEALQTLEKGLENKPKDPTLLLSKAELLIDENRLEEARFILGKLREARVAEPIVRYLEARVKLSEGHWQEATQSFERVRAQLNNFPAIAWQADMLLGLCYLQSGDLDRMVAAYRRAITAKEDDPAPRLQLASALVQLGKLEEAQEECDQLTRRANCPDRAYALRARVALARTLRLASDKRDWAPVNAALDDAMKHQPDSMEVAIMRADALLGQDKTDQARQLLEQARDKYPDRSAPWSALVLLAERTKGPDQSLALMDQAQKKLGDSADLRFLRIRYWSKRRGQDAEKALAELARGLGRFSQSDQVRLQAALAEAYLALGDTVQAEKLWSALAEKQPENLRIRLFLFDLALLAGKEDRMEQLKKEIHALEGEAGVYWRACEVSQLLARARKGDKSGLPEVHARLAELAPRRARWSRVALLEADLNELEGDQDRALENYLKAIDLGEAQPTLVTRVVQMLLSRKRYADADNLTRKLQERSDLAAVMGRLAAETALATGDKERALDLARQTLSPQGKDYRELLWYCRFLMALDRRAETEKQLERAIEVGAQAPEAWLTFIEFLARTDQKDRADAMLQEAQKKVPADQVALTLARGYEVLDQTVLADQQFRAAVAARPDDPATLRIAAHFYARRGQFAMAETHLRKLLTLKGEGASENAAWARRQLAIGLAAQGGYERFQEAISLIDQNLRTSATIEDRRTKARILAIRPSYHKEAIALLESTRPQAAFTQEELMLLAQLYRTQRDWAKEKQQVQAALAMDAKNPNYVAFYVGELLTHGDKDEAQVWQTTLDKLQPRAFATTALKARLLHARGQDDQAVRLLRDYAAAIGEDQYVTVAATLEQIGQLAPAEELYRRSAGSPKHADTVLSLIAFLVRQGKMGEALELLDKAWDNYRPEAVALASLTLLQQAQLTPQQWQRILQRVQEALKKSPQNTTLLSCEALIRDFHQGHPGEAIPIYREILNREPNDYRTLNNLAMLVSLHEQKHGEALELINRALAITGPEGALLDTRGLIYYRSGRFDQAIRDLEEAVAIEPSPYRYFHLAQARLAAQDRKGAVAARDRAQSLGLKQEGLHPLERGAYQKLRTDLSTR